MKLTKEILGSMIASPVLASAYTNILLGEDSLIPAGIQMTKSELSGLTKEQDAYLTLLAKTNGLEIEISSKSTVEGGNSKMFAGICGDDFKLMRTHLAKCGELLDSYNTANKTTYWIQIAYMRHPKSKKSAE